MIQFLALLPLAGLIPATGLADPTHLRDPGRMQPRGRIGIEVLPMSDQLREAFGVDPKVGVLVARVDPESPAQKAGIRAGDVLLLIGDQTIASPRVLIGVARRAPEGQPLTIALWRDGAEQRVDVSPRGAAWPQRWDAESQFEEHMRQMQKRLDQMQQRIDELERRRPGP